MSTYKATLSQVFPHCIATVPHNVETYVKALMDPRLREDVPQGSSFAVTVDNWNGTWNLWLSEVSYAFVQRYIAEVNS